MSNGEDKLNAALDALRNQKPESPEVEVEQDSSQDQEVEIEQPEEKPKEPRRSEFVETDDPKVKARIDDLYGQVKKSDARNQMILEHNKTMEQKLSEAMEELAKFKQDRKKEAADKVENELLSKMKEARESGDFDTADKISNDLIGLRIERRIPEQKPETPKQPEVNPRDVENAAYVEYLANERDSTGNFERPYLYNWHPDNKKATELMASIPQEFAAAGKQPDIQTIFATLHERMKGKPKNAGQQVLGSSDDAPTKKTVKLSQAELMVAKRMGITPEAYARQKQLINS